MNRNGDDHLDELFLRKANEIALESARLGFDPFGAVLVKENQVLASSIDKCIQYSDPTSHAELILISEFCRQNNLISLQGYTIYCNVEPCVMCSGAIHWARISKVVFGVRQSVLQSVSKGKLKPSCKELLHIGNRQIEIIGPLMEEEGLQILERYPFKSKEERHKIYHKRGKKKP